METNKMNVLQKLTIALWFWGVLFSFSACTPNGGSDSPLDEGGFGDGVLAEITTNKGGKLTSKDGGLYVPKGAVSSKDDGSEGVIAFSAETVSPEELTKKIPSQYSLVGNVIKYGPSAFTFARPITVYLSGKSLDNLEGIRIIWLDEVAKKWKVLPITDINSSEKMLGVATFQLGYFAAVRETSTVNRGASENRKSGGIWMEISPYNNYWHTVRVVDFTPKYPEDARFEMKGTTGRTGIFVDHLKPVCMVGLPQGNYVLEISRSKLGTPSDLPGDTKYCPEYVKATVSGFIKPLDWNYSRTSHRWTEIRPCSFNSMISGIPPSFPTADKTYGTGQFQATLNWTNNYGTTSDIDLGVQCPNGDFVYYISKSNSDRSLRLDRDWMNETGYATENIYSTKALPKGKYKVMVQLYNGYQKNYEVRVLLNKKVKTFRGLLVNTEKWIVVYEFTVK